MSRVRTLVIFLGLSVGTAVPMGIAVWHSFHENIRSAIDQGARYYTPEHMARLRIDDALLYRLLFDSGNIAGPRPDFSSRFRDDPARRLLDASDPIADLEITRKASGQKSSAAIWNSFYAIRPPYDQALRDPYDDILFKAIDCDRSGYDAEDFAILRSIGSGRGDSADTHLLFGLLILKGNSCHTGPELENEIDSVAERVAAAALRDEVFSDLYAERIVFLSWAGYGDRVQASWIRRIAESRQKDGWRDGSDADANAHTTGLALLALVYYEEGKSRQPLYPIAAR